MTLALWALLAIAAAALQTVRNAAQRSLIGTIGLMGATWVRFLYGLPFGLAWLALVFWYRDVEWATIPGLFLGWTIAGAVTQAAATYALLIAMRGRAFAIATALQKTEVLGAALLGVALIGDHLGLAGWLGVILGTGGVLLAGGSVSVSNVDRASAVRAGFAGGIAGLGFAFSSVAYRAATQAWVGDVWAGAAAALVLALGVQTILGFLVLLATERPMIAAVLRSWRPSLLPGFAGAAASALWFTAFALAPSAAAVKTVGLIDVFFAWMVSRRILSERLSMAEWVGALLILGGAATVLLS